MFKPILLYLVIAVGNRILSVKLSRELAQLESLDQIRAQTTQILDKIPQELVRTTLEDPSRHLIFTLEMMNKVEG